MPNKKVGRIMAGQDTPKKKNKKKANIDGWEEANSDADVTIR